MNIRTGFLSFTVCCLFVPHLQAAGVDNNFAAALASDQRPAEDKARDAARKPAQVIKFLGIEPGMTVMDVIAAAGWYTEVLSAAVGPEGRVISQNSERLLQMGDGSVARQYKARVDRLGNVEILLSSLSQLSPAPEAAYSGDTLLGPVETSPAAFAGKIDAAITALNLHDVYNFGGEDAARATVDTIFKMLKPGGVFGVIDHVGIDGQDNVKLHRIKPEVARALITGAGFKIEAVSDILANPKDDHTLNVFDPALGRNTDRFIIKARKPVSD